MESGAGFNLDVSLFERMAQQRPRPAPIVTLAMQRRMLPAIAALIRGPIYPDLLDAPSVLAYPPVRGIAQPLFWLDHQFGEKGEEEEEGARTGSKCNEGEARLVVVLAKYLIHQGYQPRDIAVLTPYVGQLSLLRRQLGQARAPRLIPRMAMAASAWRLSSPSPNCCCCFYRAGCTAGLRLVLPQQRSGGSRPAAACCRRRAGRAEGLPVSPRRCVAWERINMCCRKGWRAESSAAAAHLPLLATCVAASRCVAPSRRLGKAKKKMRRGN